MDSLHSMGLSIYLFCKLINWSFFGIIDLYYLTEKTILKIPLI